MWSRRKLLPLFALATIASLTIGACGTETSTDDTRTSGTDALASVSPTEQPVVTTTDVTAGDGALQLVTTGFDSPTGDFDNPQEEAAKVAADEDTKTFAYNGMTISTNYEYLGTTVIVDGDATHVFPGIALTNGLLITLDENPGGSRAASPLVIRDLSDLASEPTLFDPGVPVTAIVSETTLVFLGDTAFAMVYFSDLYEQGNRESRDRLAAWKVFGLDLAVLAEGSGPVEVDGPSLLKCCIDGDRGILFTAP